VGLHSALSLIADALLSPIISTPLRSVIIKNDSSGARAISQVRSSHTSQAR
jgi:hypothetical protein